MTLKHNSGALLILLILNGAICFAQPVSNGKNDPEAKRILDISSAKLKSFKSIQSNFTFTIEDAAGKLEGSKSGVIYVKESKYHIVITGQEIFCDGKDVWTYDKSSNEVTITKSDPTIKTISPESIFTNFYDKDFLYKLNGQVRQDQKVLEEIELTPVDKTKPFFKAYLYIDKGTHLIHALKLLEKDGNRYTISINKLNGNGMVKDDQFVFDKSKFPSVEQVDLRN